MYFTDSFLKNIREWDVNNFEGLFSYIREEWYNNSGRMNIRTENSSILVELDTGGSMLNEIIIGSLALNPNFWMIYWFRSEKNGRYTFQKTYTEIVNNSNHLIDDVQSV
jgi:hypothetical protein